MKIAVVGTGAMGSIYAALLAEAGNEVWAIDTWAEHVAAINATGLRVHGASGDRTVTSIRASTSVADAAGCELYIVATKADGVGSAARAIAASAPSDAVVLTIQNGLGAFDRIAEFLPGERVLLGVAQGFGASMVGPGDAHHNGMKLIRLGEPAGGISERLERVVQVWQHAGFEVEAFEDIEQLIWEKFICNVALSGPCTVMNCTVGELMDDPERWSVALGCMDEAYRVGLAGGVRFSFDDQVGYVTEFASGLRGARPSMLLDRLAGRRSEIDAINGQVCVRGRAVGVATPYNDTVAAVVRALEADTM